MSEKIKVIVKRPNETYGHSTHIDNTLEAFQKVVGGPIETVRLTNNVVIVVNEEGKAIKGFPRNFRALRPFPFVLFGTIAVVGVNGENFTDCPMEKFMWEAFIDRWTI